MSGEKREQFSTTMPSKWVNIIRRQALIEERITMSEMLERYQQAYLREQERERTEKKAKEKAEKAKTKELAKEEKKEEEK